MRPREISNLQGESFTQRCFNSAFLLKNRRAWKGSAGTASHYSDIRRVIHRGAAWQHRKCQGPRAAGSLLESSSSQAWSLPLHLGSCEALRISNNSAPRVALGNNPPSFLTSVECSVLRVTATPASSENRDTGALRAAVGSTDRMALSLNSRHRWGEGRWEGAQTAGEVLAKACPAQEFTGWASGRPRGAVHRAEPPPRPVCRACLGVLSPLVAAAAE